MGHHLPFGKVRELEPKPFVGAKNAKDLENFLLRH